MSNQRSDDSSWMEQRDQAGLALLDSATRRRALLRGSEGRMLAQAVANVSFPKAIGETLRCNPRFVPDFYRGIGQTLYRSMHDPETRPRIWSDEAIKERLGIIYDMAERLHGEGNATIKMTMDRLWEAVKSRMARMMHPDDVAEKEIVGSQDDYAGSEEETARMWAGEARQGFVRVGPEAPEDIRGK